MPSCDEEMMNILYSELKLALLKDKHAEYIRVYIFQSA